MQMDLTTPGLLFPAISLLLLAYTNRFVVLANVIRQLSALKDEDTRDLARRQIENLRRRLMIIRLMQLFGVLSFVLCTVSMFALFIEWGQLGEILFGSSLLLLVLSLLFSLYEVQISTQAIHIELERLNR
jgi:hypothetical protein